jgi:2-C-methyl-D-erythritol 2,4-cyclodiphosphate synthase
MSRAGIGYDSHRLAQGRRLILGGVEIPGGELGLEGHSDADVLTHAVIDALLGAAGMGDIGEHFPDTDERWRDADSIELLKDVVAKLSAAGLGVMNVDCTVVMERPKLGAHREQIRGRLAQAIGLEERRVNVKATTGEGIGFVGRGEGVAALAIASLEERSTGNAQADDAQTGETQADDAQTGETQAGRERAGNWPRTGRK